VKSKKWQKISTERVFDHKHFRVNKDLVRLPDDKKIEWFYWDSLDSAMIVPVTSSGKLVMIRQYRYLPNQIALEFPSGKSNKGESLEDCVRRELKEETGCTCENVIKLGEFYETMAQLNRRIHIYLAEDTVLPGKNETVFSTRSQDEYEETELVLKNLTEFVKMVSENKVISMGSSLATLLAKEHLLKK